MKISEGECKSRKGAKEELSKKRGEDVKFERVRGKGGGFVVLR